MNSNNVFKKSWVIIISILICIFIIPVNCLAESASITNSAQMAAHVYRGYNHGQPGPISVTPVILYSNENENVNAYLIGLSGTEFVRNQSTDILTDLESGFDLSSPYLTDVVDVINHNIPRNSNLIIAGHSLGGMIAEQTAGNSNVKANYNIMNVITFGSPLVHPFGREGYVQRLGDSADLVPYLSISGTLLLPWQILGLNRENGGYNNSSDAHIQSYLRDDEWGSYDALGYKYGTSHIVYNTDNVRFYAAPIM